MYTRYGEMSDSLFSGRDKGYNYYTANGMISLAVFLFATVHTFLYNWDGKEINQKMEQTIIPKKAYLGNRNLETFKIENTITSIEDWAFASCKNLHTIWIPKTLSYMGKQVFEGCESLDRIYIYDETQVYEQEGLLLAFAVRHFHSPRVYEFENVGSDFWYEWYDQYLLSYIGEPEDKDFQPFLAGGEEDYEDPKNNIDAFCDMVLQEKVRGILLRLMADKGNAGDIHFFEEMVLFLSEHKQQLISKILCFREMAIEYIKCLGEKQILTTDNIEDFLEAFQGNLYGEARAYLLGEKERLVNNRQEEVWNAFNL